MDDIQGRLQDYQIIHIRTKTAAATVYNCRSRYALESMPADGCGYHRQAAVAPVAVAVAVAVSVVVCVALALAHAPALVAPVEFAAVAHALALVHALVLLLCQLSPPRLSVLFRLRTTAITHRSALRFAPARLRNTAQLRGNREAAVRFRRCT